MIPMSVKFVAKGDPAPWSDAKDAIDAGVLADVVVLDDGMESGLPSVAFRIALPDGRKVIVQQTGRQIATLGRMMLARYPQLLD